MQDLKMMDQVKLPFSNFSCPYYSTLYGHPLTMLKSNWTNDAASRHTTILVSHTKPSPM